MRSTPADDAGRPRYWRAILASTGMPSLQSLAFHHASTSRSTFVSAGSARYFSRSSCSTTGAAAAAAAPVGGGAIGMAKNELDAPILAAAVAEAVVTAAGAAAVGAAAGAAAAATRGFQSRVHAPLSASMATFFASSRSVVQPGKTYVLKRGSSSVAMSSSARCSVGMSSSQRFFKSVCSNLRAARTSGTSCDARSHCWPVGFHGR
mmetsp:Transcript_5177/g.11104  ORF Transcript_5177/g.11104 Transcript_5177/m.11104 type:complete len:206 (-) Transcript_5177:681-1298(-)